MSAPASRAARPRLVALASGRYSVRFRGAVVLSRVSLAEAESFVAAWDGSLGRAAYPACRGVSHAERCREYRARVAARARLAALPPRYPTFPPRRPVLPVVLAVVVLAVVLALPGSALAALAPLLSGPPVASPALAACGAVGAVLSLALPVRRFSRA